MRLHHTMLVAGLSLSGAAVSAQQVPDTTFVSRTGIPAYALGKGPRLVIDGAHMNFHTVDGRYSPLQSSRHAMDIASSDVMGFNEPSAPQNAQLALNVLHWLSGLLSAQ